MKFFKLFGSMFIFFLILKDFSIGSQINKYNEKVYIDKDGNALVEVIVNIKTDSTKLFILPFNYKKCDNLKLNESNTGEISLTGENGTRFITIKLKEILPDSMTFHFSFNVPSYFDFENAEKSDFGNFSHQYRFVNTTMNTINTFSGEIIMPEGYVVTSIESSYPKLSEKNPIAPYELSQNGKCYSTTIKSTKMKIGDYASIQFRFKKSEKSKILLFALLGAAVLYLIFYRDVLKNGDEPKKV
jgi:hypothetical protein